MSLLLEEKDLKKVILIGDKVLIKPKTPTAKTKSGLFLPPSVSENEKVLLGYIVKVGPGIPIPMVNDDDELWKKENGNTKYIQLQAQAGDQAIFMQSESIEIEFNDEKYLIVSQSSILMLVRDEGLFE